jgi:hypothetical protein
LVIFIIGVFYWRKSALTNLNTIEKEKLIVKQVTQLTAEDRHSKEIADGKRFGFEKIGVIF